MNKPFFINIVPTNDRREIINYSDLLKNIFQDNINDYFKYSLFTVGEQRLDPTIIAQHVLNLNPSISPLIAVNPFYQSPLLTAKKMATLQQLYPNKAIGLNLVTGSFINGQKNAGDHTDLETRNSRLIDFFICLQELSGNQGKSTIKSKHYSINDFIQYPPLNIEQLPIILSGAFIHQLRPFKNVYYLQNYRPIEEMQMNQDLNNGLALGIFARASEEDARRDFQSVYKEDRKGEMLFKMALNNSETPWNKWLKNYLSQNDINRLDYNLIPLLTLKSAAPFIVGSYDQVYEKIKALNELGNSFFTIDFEPNEFHHIKKVLDRFI